jgi:Tfp pilus assembly protein PilN
MTIQTDLIAGLAVGLVITGLVGAVVVERAQVKAANANTAAAETQLTQVEAINAANVAEIAKFKASEAQVNAAATLLAQEVAADQAGTDAAVKKYSALAGQSGQDAKDAPVLSSYFADLRGQK